MCFTELCFLFTDDQLFTQLGGRRANNGENSITEKITNGQDNDKGIYQVTFDWINWNGL